MSSPMMRSKKSDGEGSVEFDVVTRGAVPEEAVDFAMDRLATVLGEFDDVVLFARLKLSTAADPARAKPALAQVTIDIDGDVVRAHVAAHEMHAAIDLLQRRVRSQLEHRAERRDWLRTSAGLAAPGEWRHATAATERPEWFDRPEDERQLVRHKTLAAGELTADEAAFDLEQLDFDFYLFRDISTGGDAIIERAGPGTYDLTVAGTLAPDLGVTAVPIHATGRVVATLSVDEAIVALEASGTRRVFFADAASGRGTVVYHRYDGHYGLIMLGDSAG